MIGRDAVLVGSAVFAICAHPLAGPTKAIPAITTFVGEGAADTLRTFQADGLGVYRNTVTKGTQGVQSIIQTSGAWELDAYYFTSNRRLYFDLRNPVADSTIADAPSGIVVAPGRLITKCGSTTDNFLQMDPAVPLYNCSLHGRFDYNGRTMLVRMDQAFPGSRNVKVSCTGVDPANASVCQHWRIDTCTAQDAAGSCTQWGFQGGPVDLTANVMTLMEEGSTKGKLTTRKVGDYYMQAEIYVSKQ